MEHLLAIISQILTIVLLVVAGIAIRMAVLLIINKSSAILNHPSSSLNKGHIKKIVILGDSTANGVGARQPEDSIAGRLIKNFPYIGVLTLAEDGSRVRDLLSQIKKAENEKFNLAIISTGGNDTWKFSDLDQLRIDIARSVDMIKEICDNRIILLIYSDIGFAPFFPTPIRRLIRNRMIKIRDIFTAVAKEKGIAYVDLSIQEDEKNPYAGNPRKLFAKDGLHPSSEAYGIWYRKIFHDISEYY